MHTRRHRGHRKSIVKNDQKAPINGIKWSNTNGKIWTKKSRDEETNEDFNNSMCGNECTNDQENKSLINADSSITESVSKCINDNKCLDCPLFHSESAIQHV